MSISLNNKQQTQLLQNQMQKLSRKRQDSLEKLSSGKVFTSLDPRPSQRALSERLEHKIRSIASSKQEVNQAVSFIQTAESSLEQMNHMIQRMKELGTMSSSPTMGDLDRKFLLIEYQALHDEVNRLAKSTEFNGVHMLDPDQSNLPKEFVVNMGVTGENGGDDQTLKLDRLADLGVSTDRIGLNEVGVNLKYLDTSEGVSLDDIRYLNTPDDSNFSSSFDEALAHINEKRAVIGGMHSRLNQAMDFLGVYQENTMAAKSTISDTDYAEETANLAESSILLQANTSLLSQTNFNQQTVLNLIQRLPI